MASTAEIPTIEVPETQVESYHPDNQLGLEQSQAMEPEQVVSADHENDAEMKGVQDTQQEVKEDDGEKKDGSELTLAQLQEKNMMPETMNYEQGPDGTVVLGSEAANGSCPEGACGSLVRRDAFLEEDETDLLEQTIVCKKCGMPLQLEESVVRGPRELWCKECNSIYTMLRRHQKWPPSSFSALSEQQQQQQQFFATCRQQKLDSKKSMFSYKSIRDTLISSLSEEKINQKKVETGGTYLPISVYQTKGYICDAGFKSRNPKMWSDGLQDWVYLLAETSINEAEIKNSIERQIVEAERQIRKRKASDVVPQAIEDEDNKSTVTQKTEVCDLLTESEDEGEAGDKKLTPKQLEEKMKRDAKKITKEEKAAQRKEEASRKKQAKAVTKKTISLSSKLSAPLVAALHKASHVMSKAAAAGVEDHEDVVAYKDVMKTLEEYKVKCNQALTFYSKNPNCELSSLPFENEKEVTTMIKELHKQGMDIKKNVIQPTKGKK